MVLGTMGSALLPGRLGWVVCGPLGGVHPDSGSVWPVLTFLPSYSFFAYYLGSMEELDFRKFQFPQNHLINIQIELYSGHRR